jgi:hypothetical protein
MFTPKALDNAFRIIVSFNRDSNQLQTGDPSFGMHFESSNIIA